MVNILSVRDPEGTGHNLSINAGEIPRTVSLVDHNDGTYSLKGDPAVLQKLLRDHRTATAESVAGILNE